MSFFSSRDRTPLKKPSVAAGHFVAIEHPTLGTLRFHDRVGRVQAGGHEWRGVAGLFEMRTVGVETVMDARTGQPLAVRFTISGADAKFMREMRSIARGIARAPASVFLGMVDHASGAVLMFRSVLPGLVASAQAPRQGIGRRTLVVTIVGDDTPAGRALAATGAGERRP